MSKREDYWLKREMDNLDLEKMKDEEVSKLLSEVIKSSMDTIKEEIDGMYYRYAKKEGIPLNIARQRIDKIDVDRYERLANKYVNDKVISKAANERMRLYNVSLRINREKLLLARLNAHVVNLGIQLENIDNEYLTDGFIREVKRQSTILGSINIDRSDIEAIVGTRYKGKVWSERLWEDMDMLKKYVHKTAQDVIVRGRHPNEYVKDLQEMTGRTEFESKRLLITEVSRVQTQAQRVSYEQNGVAQYTYTAKLDDRTSKLCRKMNDEVFDVKDMKIGINAPPMHPFCRSITLPKRKRKKRRGVKRISQDERDRLVNGDLIIDDEKQDDVVMYDKSHPFHNKEMEIKRIKEVDTDREYVDIEIDVAETKEQLKHIANTLDLNITNAVYNKVDHKAIKQYFKLTREHPQVKEMLDEYDSNFRVKSTTDALGQVTTRYFKDTGKIDEMDLLLKANIRDEHVKDAIDEGHFMQVDEDKVSQYIITHEYGHLLHNALGYRRAKKRKEDYSISHNNEVAEEIMTKIYEEIGDELGDHISSYGKSSKEESIAELFTHYILSATVNIAAEAMMLIIDKMFKEEEE